MINSAQSIEGARFTPEKKQPVSYEKVTTMSPAPSISKVSEKLDTTTILESLNQAVINDTKSSTVENVLPANPVSVSKFVLEAKAIFINFITGLNQVAVPSKSAQELT